MWNKLMRLVCLRFGHKWEHHRDVYGNLFRRNESGWHAVIEFDECLRCGAYRAAERGDGA